MRPQTTLVAALRPQPWRNGGGMTRELIAAPGGAEWNVRLSVADVTADGAFSAYPGVVRWFAVVEGNGVDLDFGSETRRITRGDPPLRFNGAAAPMCRLVDGPTRDLNLMLRGSDGAMLPATDHRPWSPAGASCGLFTAVAGVCHADSRRERVPAHALLWYDAAPPILRFAADVDTGAPVGWWLQCSIRGTR